MVDKKNNKNISIEIFILIIIRLNNKDLLIGYKFRKDEIVYNEI